MFHATSRDVLLVAASLHLTKEPHLKPIFSIPAGLKTGQFKAYDGNGSRSVVAALQGFYGNGSRFAAAAPQGF